MSKKNENKRPAHWMPRAGDAVDYHSIIGGPITSQSHIVKKVGTDSAGQPVAWLIGGEEKPPRGYVHIDALTPIPIPNCLKGYQLMIDKRLLFFDHFNVSERDRLIYADYFCPGPPPKQIELARKYCLSPSRIRQILMKFEWRLRWWRDNKGGNQNDVRKTETTKQKAVQQNQKPFSDEETDQDS